MLINMNDNEDNEDYDYPTYFLNCTCHHTEEEHGWGECNVEGCECEGGWEE